MRLTSGTPHDDQIKFDPELHLVRGKNHGATRWLYPRFFASVIAILKVIVPIVVYKALKLWLEGDVSPFPDIDYAWKGVFEKLVEQQEELEWTDDGYREDHKSQLLAQLALGFDTLLVLALAALVLRHWLHEG